VVDTIVLQRKWQPLFCCLNLNAKQSYGKEINEKRGHEERPHVNQENNHPNDERRRAMIPAFITNEPDPFVRLAKEVGYWKTKYECLLCEMEDKKPVRKEKKECVVIRLNPR